MSGQWSDTQTRQCNIAFRITLLAVKLTGDPRLCTRVLFWNSTPRVGSTTTTPPHPRVVVWGGVVVDEGVMVFCQPPEGAPKKGGESEPRLADISMNL